jgi:hypothetical protein
LFENLENLPNNNESELHLHWLSIEGHIAHTPSNLLVEDKEEKVNLLLPGTSFKLTVTPELKNFYEKSIAAIMCTTPSLVDGALESLREECGFSQILPYFAKFISDEVSDEH